MLEAEHHLPIEEPGDALAVSERLFQGEPVDEGLNTVDQYAVSRMCNSSASMSLTGKTRRRASFTNSMHNAVLRATKL